MFDRINHKTMKRIAFVLLIILLIGQYSFPQEKRVKSKVASVTVYSLGAQVSRTVQVKLEAGENRIIFSNLPPNIDEQSVQVSCGQATLLSVSYQRNVLDSLAANPEYAKLQTRRKELERKIRLEKAQLQSIAIEKDVLLANKQLIGTQGVKLEEMKASMAYFRTKLEEYDRTTIEKAEVISGLEEELNKVNRQIQEISSQGRTETGEIAVTLKSDKALTVPAELKYFTQAAGWYPSYDIRVNGLAEPILVDYKANIHQTTGEDWSKVKLTISSGDPTTSSISPQLYPWMLDFQRPVYSQYGRGSTTNSFGPTTVRGAVTGRVIDAQDGTPLPGVSVLVSGTSIGTSTDVNGYYRISIPQNASTLTYSFVGMETQVIPITSNQMDVTLQSSMVDLEEVVITGYGSTKRAEKAAKQKPMPAPIPVTTVEYKTSFSFQIELPYDVSSNGKSVGVTLNSLEINADYRYYSAPKLNPSVFLETRFTGWEQYNFMDGEANLYFEDKYVGRTLFSVSDAKDTISLSLGKDESVSIKRTKLQTYREKNLIGSKRTEKREFEIAVRNSKNEEVPITIMDQIPISTNEEIKVKDVSSSGGRLNQNKGIITWELRLKPGESKQIRFGYSVEYPAGKSIVLE